jgi:hypothetical protein
MILVTTNYFAKGEMSHQYIVRCGEISMHDPLMIRLFLLSLSGLAFCGFTSLPPNSINGCVDLEKKFHKYIYTEINELKHTDLTSVR